MQNTLEFITAVASEILDRKVPERDGLPAHVWAYQLQTELAHARAALAQIRGTIANLDDTDVIVQEN